ncbi:3'-5' exonuclease [Kamptonema cortianum]|nr:3'-5' exonuclease [Kamptonema cortianum]MDL5046189.1 3'-5' exonuclease [Oscillatoria amoena NRMC-F 0135]
MTAKRTPEPPPSREEIQSLPSFSGLRLDQISVIETAHAAQMALAEMSLEDCLGFDTESKPVFKKDQQSKGPHIVQFATAQRAWIFHAHKSDTLPAVIQLLASPQILKIGFGLKDDLIYIVRKFGVEPAGIVDLNHSFKHLGHKNTIGAKTAIAMLFGQKLAKSKKVTTSDWSRPILSDNQILYAANDAYAAIRVYRELQNRSALPTP